MRCARPRADPGNRRPIVGPVAHGSRASSRAGHASPKVRRSIQSVDSRQLHQQAAGQRPLIASRVHIKIFINIAAEFLHVCRRSSLLRIADGCGQTQ